MSADLSKLAGAHKAAIVILGLDPGVAKDILRHLPDADIRKLAASMEAMQSVPVDVLEATLAEFDKRMQQPVTPTSTPTYLRKLVVSALGEDRARDVFDPPYQQLPSLEAIRTAHVSALSDLLQDEHPQIAAVILSQLPRERAARVLAAMPIETQSDLVRRIANLHEIPTQALKIASDALANALESTGMVGEQEGIEDFDGVSFTAHLLNELASSDSDRILSALGQADSPLTTMIRDAMFTFEDLTKLPTRSLQQLMRDIPTPSLLTALKTAPEELRERFFGAVSTRAAEQMREELQLLPPTKLSEVENAQRTIVEIALKLAADGRITIPSAGGEKLV